jgi:hypothetical protein
MARRNRKLMASIVPACELLEVYQRMPRAKRHSKSLTDFIYIKM